MGISNIAQLHGRSLADAIDLLYRQTLDRLIPVLASQAEQRRQELLTRTDQIIAELQSRETSRETQIRRHLEKQDKARADALPKPPNEQARKLGARYWIRFSPSATHTRWAPGLETDLHQRALQEAASPLIEALCNGECGAVGVAEHRLQDARVPPEFFRARLWVLYRERSRLVELSVRDKELWPGCCDVRLAPPIRLTRVQTVAAAMEALSLPIDTVEKSSFDSVRRQLNGTEDPLSLVCAKASDATLKKLMQRANEERKKARQD